MRSRSAAISSAAATRSNPSALRVSSSKRPSPTCATCSSICTSVMRRSRARAACSSIPGSSLTSSQPAVTSRSSSSRSASRSSVSAASSCVCALARRFGDPRARPAVTVWRLVDSSAELQRARSRTRRGRGQDRRQLLDARLEGLVIAVDTVDAPLEFVQALDMAEPLIDGTYDLLGCLGVAPVGRPAFSQRSGHAASHFCDAV